jgi:hypothetical protein
MSENPEVQAPPERQLFRLHSITMTGMFLILGLCLWANLRTFDRVLENGENGVWTLRGCPFPFEAWQKRGAEHLVTYEHLAVNLLAWLVLMGIFAVTCEVLVRLVLRKPKG